MATIYDYVSSDNIVGYWNAKNDAETENLLGPELWPARQKRGLKLENLYGASGIPVVIRPSAYDVAALKMDRLGFETMSFSMPFFKDSTDIDEELRQQLNDVLETGNEAKINMVINLIFDDQMRLLRGAKAQRERMRMMLLMTGGISITANGQSYDYDFGLKSYQKVTVKKSWSDPSADIMSDLEAWTETVYEQTGIRPTRAVVNPAMLKYFRENTLIKNAYWGNASVAPISQEKAMDYVQTESKLQIIGYNRKFIDEKGVTRDTTPEDTLSMFPSGPLGTGWFGTTPEQSDLMSGTAANVTITDTGVAVTTSKKVDPVNVDTKVSMIYLPSFEQANQVLIADLKAPTTGG